MLVSLSASRSRQLRAHLLDAVLVGLAACCAGCALKAEPQSDLEALCRHSYAQLALGEELNRAGVPKERCVDAVAERLKELERDPTFLAPLRGHSYDKRAYVYIVIGGGAALQCERPRPITYDEHRATVCEDMIKWWVLPFNAKPHGT
jgi:hypothetical protein